MLSKVIKYGATALQLRATDVMLSAIQHDPAPLRSFMRNQKDHELFHLLVRSVVVSKGIACLPTCRNVMPQLSLECHADCVVSKYVTTSCAPWRFDHCLSDQMFLNLKEANMDLVVLQGAGVWS